MYAEDHMGQVNQKKIYSTPPHNSETLRPNLVKLSIYKLPGCTLRTEFQQAINTWVVCVNSQAVAYNLYAHFGRNLRKTRHSTSLQ